MAQATNKGGRPSKFKPEFLEQAQKLAALRTYLPQQDQWIADRLVDIRRDRGGKHAERRAQRNAYKARRRAANPSERVRNAVGARLWAVLKGRSDGALFSRLGYTPGELVAHLEARFEPGMSWDNYGRWHIDHRRPCASFDLTSSEQFDKCWSLENLQPLWARDNLVKGASYGCA